MPKTLFNYENWIKKVKKKTSSKKPKKPKGGNKKKVFVFHAFEDPVLNFELDGLLLYASAL